MGRGNRARAARPGRVVSSHRRVRIEGLRFEPLEPRWMLTADAGVLDYATTIGLDVPVAALNGTAEIHGTKWSDFDGDGDRDEGEPGLAGVTIYLDADNDSELDAEEMRTVTAFDNVDTDQDETGAYAFTGLMPGTYQVREVVPTGYEQTYPLAKTSEFNIIVLFPDSTLTPEQQEIFVEAAARWQQIIIGDIPDADVPGFGLVDDLVIEASAPIIDGPGGILGQAGPDFVRTVGFLPLTGVMQFDAADVVELINDGQFDEVILHEMGHVLGIGTIWQPLGLLTGVDGPDPRFTGAQATAEYNAIFGLSEAGVPVEGDFGPGTALAHWDEETFNNELMTGFLDGGVPNPISRVTVGQMADLGYEVDLNAADPYEAPNLRGERVTLDARPERRIEVLDRPLRFVDSAPPAVLPAIADPDEMFWRVELADGEIVMNVDFGNRPLPGSISGRKWNDRDANGVQDPDERGLANWTVFLDEDGDGQFDGGAGTFESSDVPGPIVDFSDFTSSLNLSLAGEIRDVNVTLNISHTYDADLTITLISPAGTRVPLAVNDGGSGDNFDDTTFDDEAATRVSSSTAPFAGSFRPRAPLSTLDGESAVGEWRLEVADDFLFDDGSLNSWSITISTGEQSATTDADGNFSFPELAAGDYVVAELQQEGWGQVFPAAPGTYEIALAPGENVVGINFGNRQGFIGGQVWNDYDGDGLQDDGEPSLPGWTVFLDQNKNGVLDDGPRSFPSTELSESITDLTTITSQVTVPDLGAIGDVDVLVNIQHEFAADLDVFLISPQGTRVELFTDVGSFSNDFNNTLLDDEADLPIAEGEAPFAGSFQPEGLLAALDGEDSNGVWTLEVTDDAGSDVGTLLGWTLTLSSRERSAISDADGNFSFIDVPPGDYAVAEVVEPGWVRTAPSAPGRHEFTLGTAQAFDNADFGNRAGSISGLKWNDLDRDGLRDANEPGLPGWTVYIDQNANGVLDNGPSTVVSPDGTRFIPDLGATVSQLTINSNLPIEDLNVTLSITHGFIADLDVYLRSPSGTRVELFTDLLGGGQNFTSTTLDDEALQSILTGSEPFTESFAPVGSLADFDGENPQGTWTLELADDAGNDVGSLKGWSITIVTREQLATTDSEGRYALRDLGPGAYSVREAPQAGWQPTFPIGSSGYGLTLALGEQRAGANFGAYATTLFGDYEHDSDVDGNDFLLWQRTLGGAAVPAGSGADGDGSGTVALGDLGVWNSNYGGSLPAAAPSVVALDDAFDELDAAALAGPLAYALPGAAATRASRAFQRAPSRVESPAAPQVAADVAVAEVARTPYHRSLGTSAAADDGAPAAYALESDFDSAFGEL